MPCETRFCWCGTEFLIDLATSTSGDVPHQLLSAVSRLHGSCRDEQLAGARALANFAAQWYSDGANAHAQRCIDALCAYLRVRRYTRSPGSELAQSAVREHVTSLLTDFLRSGLGAVHGGILINLSAARIRGRHVLEGVSFGPGVRLILDRAQLEEGSRLSFVGCHFRGCVVRLQEVSLHKNAVLSLVGSTVDAQARLFASTTEVHPTARVDVPGIAAPEPRVIDPLRDRNPWRHGPEKGADQLSGRVVQLNAAAETH
jgi:hypothetical protein